MRARPKEPESWEEFEALRSRNTKRATNGRYSTSKRGEEPYLKIKILASALLERGSVLAFRHCSAMARRRMLHRSREFISRALKAGCQISSVVQLQSRTECQDSGLDQARIDKLWTQGLGALSGTGFRQALYG